MTDPSPIDVVRGKTPTLPPQPVKLPRELVAGVVAVCVVPIVLTLLGVDFGSRPVPSRPPETTGIEGVELADALHQALAGSFTHTLLEWTAVCTAFLTALLALLHFRIRCDVTTPIIGVALLCAGTMDAFHTLAAVRLIGGVAENERLIPFTWALSRMFNALILMFGLGIFLLRHRTRWQGRTSSLWIVSVVFGAISYLTIYLSATSRSLPQTIFPDLIVTRPWDVAPLILFVLAWLLVLRPFHERTPSLFTHSLLVSTLPLVATQLHMAFGSTALFDSHFNIAHFLKICAYGVPLAGLSLDYVRTYADEAAARTRFEEEAERLGQYTLEAKIGEGGMGRVYRARHVMMRRPTAVKLLLPEKNAGSNLERFEREVRLTARLTHPNTITIFDYGRTPDGIFYYAMELLEGASLDTIVEISGPQPAARVIHILDAVAGALAEAHNIRLIHRDIKPANIMLCRQGGDLDVPKVLDFGLVKELTGKSDAGLTGEGQLAGTPLYMAPETIANPDKVDHRSDLYALGAVGYFLVTAQPVFEGRTLVEVASQHLRTDPIPPAQRLGAEVPEDLQSLLLECLDKSPEDRPQTASDLRRRLASCADFGAWSEDCRRRWWESHDDALRQHKEGKITVTNASLAVDLGEDRSRLAGDTPEGTSGTDGLLE